jgi:hypothetical protein
VGSRSRHPALTDRMRFWWNLKNGQRRFTGKQQKFGIKWSQLECARSFIYTRPHDVTMKFQRDNNVNVGLQQSEVTVVHALAVWSNVIHVFSGAEETGQKGLALAGRVHQCVRILDICEIHWKQHSVQVGVWFSLHGAGGKSLRFCKSNVHDCALKYVCW